MRSLSEQGEDADEKQNIFGEIETAEIGDVVLDVIAAFDQKKARVQITESVIGSLVERISIAVEDQLPDKWRESGVEPMLNK